MAEDNIDDILVRLDEIEKLQAELRHLVPRATSDSSGHAGQEDLPRNSSASIRFPSLFTFPVISSLSSTSSTVQKSTARMNLSSRRSSSGSRASSASLRISERFSKSGGASTKEGNIFKDLLKSTSNVGRRSTYVARNALASTSSAANYSRTSTTPHLTRSTAASHPTGSSQEIIKSQSNAISGRSNVRLSRKENNVNTSDTQACTSRTMKLGSPSWCVRRNRRRNGNGTLMRTFIERIIEKLNYCFVDDKRVTIPYHHPGNKTPRRVRVLRSPVTKTIDKTNGQLHVSAAKFFVN